MSSAATDPRGPIRTIRLLGRGCEGPASGAWMPLLLLDGSDVPTLGGRSRWSNVSDSAGAREQRTDMRQAGASYREP